LSWPLLSGGLFSLLQPLPPLQGYQYSIAPLACFLALSRWSRAVCVSWLAGWLDGWMAGLRRERANEVLYSQSFQTRYFGRWERAFFFVFSIVLDPGSGDRGPGISSQMFWAMCVVVVSISVAAWEREGSGSVGAGALQRHFTLFLAAFFLASSIHPSIHPWMKAWMERRANQQPTKIRLECGTSLIAIRGYIYKQISLKLDVDASFSNFQFQHGKTVKTLLFSWTKVIRYSCKAKK
jgi:hypothetical protein